MRVIAGLQYWPYERGDKRKLARAKLEITAANVDAPASYLCEADPSGGIRTTPLIRALQLHCHAVARWLVLEMKANVNQGDPSLKVPIMFATDYNMLVLVLEASVCMYYIRVHYNAKCARLLIENNSHIRTNANHMVDYIWKFPKSRWLVHYMAGRERCRRVAALMTVLCKRALGRDPAVLVGRAVWATRMCRPWENKVK